jgi:hypothetical protein
MGKEFSVIRFSQSLSQVLEKSRILVPAAILTFSLFYYLSYSDFDFVESDWGMIVKAAELFLQGQVFYRDFSILYTPGIYLFTALSFKLFGTSLLSATIGWSILRAFSCLLIYFIGIEFMSRRASLILPFLLWLVPGTLHKSFFVFFVLLNCFLLVKALSVRGKGFYFLSGIITIITLIFRIDLFGFFVITFVLIEVLKVIKPDKKISSKLQIAVAFKNITPVIMYLAFNSALLEAFRQTADYSSTMRSFWFYLPPLGESVPFRAKIYQYLGISLPFVFYFLVFVMFIVIVIAGDFKEIDKKPLIIFLYGIMTLNQAIMWTGGLGRVSMILPPILIVNLYFILRYLTIQKNEFKKTPRKVYSLSLKSLTVLLLMFIIFSCYFTGFFTNGSIFRQFRYDEKKFLSDPKLNIYAPSENAETFNRVIKVIRDISEEDEYIFTYPNNSQLFHFVTGRKVLERYSIISEYIRSEKRQKEAIKLLDEKKVRLIISDLNDNRQSLSPFLNEYVKNNFEPMKTVDNYVFLRRKSY